jgi:EAL domain-containing protein (putative c-di-GMP-specific phosphodiesterase class I)
VVAAESLARWEHPELGTLPPALFTPVAERLGLMGELTRLMLTLSLAQHRAWAAAGMVVPVAVNVGPDSVIDPGFPAVVTEILRHEQVPGPMLALEVSEQTGTAAVSSSFFAQLAEAGVRIALDDFGTGFASLESLGGWPVNELKLDMSLVRPIASRSSFRTIVRTTIDLAHQLDVKVVAEGVESEAVRSELRSLGCDIGQGYFLGRPMPPGAFADWMRDRGQVRRSIPAQLAGPVAEAAAAARTRGAAPQWLRGLVDPVGARTLAAALVILAAYGLWQVFRWGGHQHQALIGDLAFFPPNAAGGFCAWRVSRRADLGRPTIRAWRLLSVAIWLYLLGDAIQLLYEVVLHQRPDPTWADAAYLAFYPVACAGFLAFPSRRRTRPERLRSLLDTGTIFVGGATFLWYVALGPAVASRPGFDLPDLVIFAYPIGDLLLLFGVLSLLWRGVPRASVLPLRIFATGMGMFIVADVTYDYSTIHAPYSGGDPVDTLWMVALTILWVAAACQLRTGQVSGYAAPLRPVTARPSAMPYVAVAASYLLLTVVGLRSVNFDSLGGLLLGAGDPDRGPADRAPRPRHRRGRPARRVYRQRRHRRDRNLPGPAGLARARRRGHVRGQAGRRRLLAALRGHGEGRGPLPLNPGPLIAAVDRAVRPVRGRGRGDPDRRHREQYRYRTSGCHAPLTCLRHRTRGLFRHRVLALEPAADAASGRGPVAAGRHEDREGERGRHGRADRRRDDRDQGGRMAELVADGPGEHQPGDGDDSRETACGAGITDHGQPLIVCAFRIRGGRASLPSNN